ncbi:DUF6942 family protein [Aliamphritea spongicola]|uniref:DUF6942 family protein n=1 Tax=Aliamphritea spongicola TaxID=707589 RepID=UPI00196A41F5|nr:hypothetical protein [Aliamphritea spongicola]MBN3562814.1 hypothetical protein [Aliamphritea spongicola]
MTSLGNSEAALRLYLPTPPLLENGWRGYDDTVRQNGNHWRKILIILSKIVTRTDDWRHHRDHKLLDTEAIDFSNSLHPNASIHLIAGKASWERLGLVDNDKCPSEAGFTPLDNTGMLWRRDNLILTPYPDYRQFPNAQIDCLRSALFSNSLC